MKLAQHSINILKNDNSCSTLFLILQFLIKIKKKFLIKIKKKFLTFYTIKIEKVVVPEFCLKMIVDSFYVLLHIWYFL